MSYKGDNAALAALRIHERFIPGDGRVFMRNRCYGGGYSWAITHERYRLMGTGPDRFTLTTCSGARYSGASWEAIRQQLPPGHILK